MTAAPEHEMLLVRAFDLAEALVDAVSVAAQDWPGVERDAHELGDVAARLAVLDGGERR